MTMPEQLVLCLRCKEEVPISGNTLSKRGARKYLTCPKCGYRMNNIEIEIGQNGIIASSESRHQNTKHFLDTKFRTEKQNLTESENKALAPRDKRQQYKQILMSAFKSIITSPRYLGYFLLDIFGRNEVKDSSALITGWLVVIVILLTWKGVVSVQFLEAIWRFFFPVK